MATVDRGHSALIMDFALFDFHIFVATFIKPQLRVNVSKTSEIALNNSNTTWLKLQELTYLQDL